MDVTSVADVATGVGLTILGSKDILNKLLGPSAEYLGDKAAGLLKKCDINLNTVFQKAVQKAGKKLELPGQVSPRVLKHIVEEARFCDDDFTAEYYGGILAASRGEDERDDRGVYYIATVKELSVYQLRLHYLIYHLIVDLFSQSPLNLATSDDRDKMTLYIPKSIYEQAMEFSDTEDSNVLVSHSIHGLQRHGLIAREYCCGEQDTIGKYLPDAPEGGLIVQPTVFGAELFLWSLGMRDIPGEQITYLKFEGTPVIPVHEGSCKVGNFMTVEARELYERLANRRRGRRTKQCT